MRKRREYTRKFKQQAVAQVRASSSSLSQVARELDISRSALSRWRREADLADARHDQMGDPQREKEITNLQRDLNRVKDDLDALIESLPSVRRGK